MTIRATRRTRFNSRIYITPFFLLPSSDPLYNFVDYNDLKIKLPSLLKKHSDEGHVYLNGDFSFKFSRNLDNYSYLAKEDFNDFIEEKLKTDDHLNIADIGCGLGEALKDIKFLYKDRVNVVGFDLIKLEAHNELYDFIEGDFESDNLLERHVNYFDLVMSFYVFRYFNNPFNKPYAKIKKMLKNGGRAYIDFSETSMDAWSFIGTRCAKEDKSIVIKNNGVVQITRTSPDDILNYIKENS